MSPGILLASLGVLVVAQVTRLVAPRRGGYVLALACAAVGLVVGELVSLAGHGGPSLGTLHPAADLPAMAGLEVLGALLPSGHTAGR